MAHTDSKDYTDTAIGQLVAACRLTGIGFDSSLCYWSSSESSDISDDYALSIVGVSVGLEGKNARCRVRSVLAF